MILVFEILHFGSALCFLINYNKNDVLGKIADSSKEDKWPSKGDIVQICPGACYEYEENIIQYVYIFVF